MIISIRNHIINLKQRKGRLPNKRTLQIPYAILKPFLLSMLFICFTNSVSSVNAQNIDREYSIKAAYLYNFCKYVEWPEHFSPTKENPEDNFIIGILESDPFGEALRKIAANKTVKGKHIKIHYIESIEEYRVCHMLFIPSKITKEFVTDILQKTRNKSILIIGEEEGFASSYGIINFIEINNKIRFEINTKFADNRNLKISSKLLKIGKIID
jgi:YfiR/HmsC-like